MHESMKAFERISLKAKYLKCFGEEGGGFDAIKPLNLIIGRNNSGKSTLLDMLQFAIEEKKNFETELCHGDKTPIIICEAPLTVSDLQPIFRPNTSGGGIPGANHWEYGSRYIDAFLGWNPCAEPDKKYIHIRYPSDIGDKIEDLPGGPGYLKRLASAKRNEFSERSFNRMKAERELLQEVDSPAESKMSTDGQGVTNMIQNFLSKSHLPRETVEIDLLGDLNSIMKPDAQFERIVCEQNPNNHEWGVYLEETEKGRISLSQSGSGLKSIMIALVKLHLVPVLEKRSLEKYIYAFEELENNLHPALLRRFLDYLYRKALSSGCIFFLTTHSNVAIDMFSKEKEASIVHVTHDSSEATCTTVETYVDNVAILDDLDFRASDLLQTNGVIWVEGPSDSIYINRFIELWSEGALKEGLDYQCVFYGGRLLSHLSARSPDSCDSGRLSVLRTNRNAIVVMDSDRKKADGKINETKKRIVREIESIDGIFWTTQGREIENYLPAEATSIVFEVELDQAIGRFEKFEDYLNRAKSGVGDAYASNKTAYASKIASQLTKESLNIFKKDIDLVCSRIKKWNEVFRAPDLA